MPKNLSTMVSGREQIENRLRQLEREIAETKRRLPAHSVKPPVMMDLLNLEDERDLLKQKLEAASAATSSDGI